MANLVVESGGNKGQLSYLVEAICRDFHEHDEAELRNATDKTAERSPLDNRRSARPADTTTDNIHPERVSQNRHHGIY